MEIARILDPEKLYAKGQGVPPTASSTDVEGELFRYLDTLTIEKTKMPEHAEFVDHVIKWTNNLKAGLFQCYDYPVLPRTNNDMERYLRKLKGQYRKISGRQSWNNYILRYGPYMAYHDFNDSEEKIHKRFAHAQYDEFERVMSAWQVSQETTRKRFRFRKDSMEYLKKLEDAWTSI